MNPEFDFVDDYISKLGARGQPYSLYWNAIGFGFVGIGLTGFGWLFGLVRQDRILGICLALSGLGFALAAIPVDVNDANCSSPVPADFGIQIVEIWRAFPHLSTKHRLRLSHNESE